MSWYDIKFLESATNLKTVIKRSVGKTPSTRIANAIAACLQQGRLFFESARSSPLEIQPLQIYYGIIGFAKAVAIARQLVPLNQFPQSHGISDVSPHNARVEELALIVRQEGTFQRFNDATACLGRVWYYDQSMPTWMPKPFENATALTGRTITIRDIFSRIPHLDELYEATFHERSNTLHIDVHLQNGADGLVDLRIDDPEHFHSRADLLRIVQKLRSHFPFLEKWCVREAQLAWGNSILIFCNGDKTQVEEFEPEYLVQSDGRFELDPKLLRRGGRRLTPFLEILPPVTGGITKSSMSVIAPYGGVRLSEHAWQFLGAFLLSSLVRYRPEIWQHAISRSHSSENPADDRSLALVERFLEVLLEEFPLMAAHSISYPTAR